MTVEAGTPVTLSTTDTGVTLGYTTDGTDPTAETGSLYEAPITIDKDTVIKAITTDEYGTSEVQTFNYKVRTDAPAGGDTEKTVTKNVHTGTAGSNTQGILAAMLIFSAAGCILWRKRMLK